MLRLITILFVFSHSFLFGQQLPYELLSPQIFQVNRMPMRASSFAFENMDLAKQADKTKSTNFISLNGIWKFNWVKDPNKRPLNFYQPGFDDSKWDDFKVPANWEVNHYGYPIYVNVPYDFAGHNKMNEKLNPPFDIPANNNPVGSYRKKFTLPVNWKDKQVFIHLGAVKSAFFIWVNGRKVGYSEDSKLAAEFDITPYINDNENILALEVYRWSDGSYQECQDMWRFSGIEREVYLYATPKLDVRDIAVDAVLSDDYKNGLLNITAEVNNYIFERTNTTVPEKFNIYIELVDKNGKSIYQDAKMDQRVKGRYFTNVHFKTNIKGVHQWNAETPDLYTFYITLKDAGNNILQVIPVKIGFKEIEIKGNNLLVNGKRILLKGVNRHEHHPTNGHVLTKEWMRKDMEMMKKLNINAVRNSHYPPDPYWLQLCDEYGLYVIDEANMESHGLGYNLSNQLANRPDWSDAILARSQRMYERDKNHASVIIWSMGNESGDGAAFYKTYDWLKNKTYLPVQYEGADAAGYTDILAPMYLSPDMLKSRAATERRPVIMCEYAHIMGNSMGNFKEYLDVIETTKGLQGGFIWEWLDQSIDTVKNGKRIKAYGGDFPFGEPADNNFSDNNFCVKGVVDAYRNETPVSAEVKKVYQPVATELLNKRLIKIKNKNFFKPLSNVYLKWELTEDGILSESGILNELNIAPRTEKSFSIPYKHILSGNKEYLLNIRYCLSNPEPFLEEDYEFANEQFILIKGKPYSYKNSTLKINVEKTGNDIILTGTNFKISFSNKDAALKSYEVSGENIFESAAVPSFWRAPVDNDFGAGYNKSLRHWRNAFDRKNLVKHSVYEQNDGSVILEFTTGLLNDIVTCLQQFHVFQTGSILVKNGFTINKYNLLLLRAGNDFVMNKSLDKISWYGRGPGENYWDRKSASLIGVYNSRVDEQYYSYARPQESGNKSDVRWVRFLNDKGNGIEFCYADSLLNFSALPYSLDDLDPEIEKKQYHSGELERRNKTYLHIDLQQTGVGGIDSWGAEPLEKYKLNRKIYKYSYWITPFKSSP